MKIGLYISPSHAVPPDEKNILAPWILVKELADALVAKRHDVTLFAAKGSKTQAHLIHGGIAPCVHVAPAYNDSDAYRSFVIAQELLLFREVIVLAKAGKLDCIHVHQPVERLYPALAALPPKFPVIVTFHDPVRPERFPGLEKLVELGNIHFVSLSHSQQKGVPFPFAGVVPNGVDTQLFRPDGDLSLEKRPFLMTGRIVPEKGFTDAIRAVQKAHERLMIVGEQYVDKKASRDYFENEVKPAIDGKTVLWEPVVKQEHLVGHYQTAKALLFPVHWEEPFGLVMVEAMACGTPVIAYNRGSVSEIVRDGLTGFIIEPDDSKTGIKDTWTIQKSAVDGLVEAIKRIGDIDRHACRRHVEKSFSLKTMVSGYEKIYQKVID